MHISEIRNSISDDTASVIFVESTTEHNGGTSGNFVGIKKDNVIDWLFCDIATLNDWGDKYVTLFPGISETLANRVYINSLFIDVRINHWI